MVLPGQADYSVGVALGYGRTACGRIGQDVGYNAYTLRTSKAPDVADRTEGLLSWTESDPGDAPRNTTRWTAAN